MPCPKCGYILIMEDGVVFCGECLYVVERKGDSRFNTKAKEDKVVKKKEATGVLVKLKPVPELAPLVRKRERHRKCRRRRVRKMRPERSSRVDPNSKRRKCNLCSRQYYSDGLCKKHHDQVYGSDIRARHLND